MNSCNADAVFILNPRAGQGMNAELLAEKIRNTVEGLHKKAQIYITKSVGDAFTYVREYCLKNGGTRFIACGGDGTLSEVLNGAYGFDNAEIGVIPSGTGNDFCRNFPGGALFESIQQQLFSKSVKCDAIKYVTLVDGVKEEGYCINMFNIGFDCNVADLTRKMKKKPFIGGSLAYFLSILVTLVKKKGADLVIELDGKVRHDGKLLLSSIANGCFCGGGIKSNPLAQVSNGLVNINIIKNVSRLRFISLLPSYMKGTHLEKKSAKKIICSENCHHIRITPNGVEKIRLCIDGEIRDAGKTEFEIVPDAFRFVVPGFEAQSCEKELVFSE